MSMRVRFFVLVAVTVLVSVCLFGGLVWSSQQAQLHAMQRLAGGMLEAFPDQSQLVVEGLLYGNAEKGADLLTRYGIGTFMPFGSNWMALWNPLVLRWAGIFGAALIGLGLCWSGYALALKRHRANQAAQRLASLDLILSGRTSGLAHPEDLESARLHQISVKLHGIAERNARDMARLQSLITDISHQIKTPLSTVQVFNELLIEGGQTPEETREFLLRGRDAVQKLSWLTESLLLLSRMETGLITIREQPADLFATVREAVNSLSHKAAEKGLSLSFEGAPLTVAHDAHWTREAIANLIDNAVKYGHPGGHVRVALVDLNTSARIDVIDDGPGVAPSEVNRIFQRFYRGVAAESSGADGAGVGLYLCRAILEAQHGSVIVEPTLGGGATFRVFLTKLSSSVPALESGM